MSSLSDGKAGDAVDAMALDMVEDHIQQCERYLQGGGELFPKDSTTNLPAGSGSSGAGSGSSGAGSGSSGAGSGTRSTVGAVAGGAGASTGSSGLGGRELGLIPPGGDRPDYIALYNSMVASSTPRSSNAGDASTTGSVGGGVSPGSSQSTTSTTEGSRGTSGGGGGMMDFGDIKILNEIYVRELEGSQPDTQTGDSAPSFDQVIFAASDISDNRGDGAEGSSAGYYGGVSQHFANVREVSQPTRSQTQNAVTTTSTSHTVDSYSGARHNTHTGTHSSSVHHTPTSSQHAQRSATGSSRAVIRQTTSVAKRPVSASSVRKQRDRTSLTTTNRNNTTTTATTTTTSRAHNVVRRRPATAVSAPSARIEGLYRSAAEKQARIEARRRQLQEEEAARLERSRSEAARRRARTRERAGSHVGGGMSRSEYLYQLAEQRKRQKEEAKRVREAESVQSCTFKPDVSVSQRRAAAHRPQESVHQHLYEMGVQRQTMRTRRAMLHGKQGDSDAQRQSAGCPPNYPPTFPFHPQINPNSARQVSSSVPVVSRLASAGRQVTCKRLRQSAAVRQQEARDCVFRPTINPVSRKLALKRQQELSQRQRVGAVGPRPMGDAERDDDGLVGEDTKAGGAIQNDGQEGGGGEEGSASGDSGGSGGGGGGAARLDVFSRQFAEMKRSQENRLVAEWQREMQDSAVYTFRPNIGSAALIAPPTHLSEQAKPGEATFDYESLHAQDAERRQHIAQMRERHFMQYTFRPQLSKVSKMIGKPSSVRELADFQKHKAVKDEVRARYISAEMAACTFKPAMSHGSKQLARLKEEARKLAHHRRQAVMQQGLSGECKGGEGIEIQFGDGQSVNYQDVIGGQTAGLAGKSHARLEMLRREKEMKELEECTFKPDISNSAYLAPAVRHDGTGKEVVPVKGLNGYMSRVKKSRQKQAALKRRQSKVFMTDVRLRPPRKTKVKPFRLSGSSARQRRSQKRRGDGDKSARQ